LRILRAFCAITPIERAHLKNANHYVLLDDGRDMSKRKYASGAQKRSNKLLSEQARAKHPKITHLFRPAREEAIINISTDETLPQPQVASSSTSSPATNNKYTCLAYLLARINVFLSSIDCVLFHSGDAILGAELSEG